MTQYVGRASVRAAGVLYETLDGATLSNPTGQSRAPTKGARVFGWTAATEVPMIDCQFPMSGALSIADLWAVTDSTVTFETDEGTIFTLGGATVTQVSKLTAGPNGNLAVQIMGITCTQN